MAASTASTSKQATATEPSPPPIVEEDEVGYITDLSVESPYCDTEPNQDIRNWSE